MDENKCRENIRLAEEMIEKGNKPDVYFWKGYLAGMKSHMNFDPDEDSLWLSYYQKIDLEHHSMGIGYRTGRNGASFVFAQRMPEELEATHAAFLQSGRAGNSQNYAKSNNSGCMVLIVAAGAGIISLVSFI